jgi:uncharacterized protein YjcR
MDNLQKQYSEAAALYEAEVQAAIASKDITPHLETLKTLNARISVILDKMVEATAKAKDESGNLSQYREQLMDNLRRIQKDYSGLSQNTDQLETLRRIRRNQLQTAHQYFSTYFFLFMLFCLTLMLLLIFRQKKESTTSTPVSAATTPTLT